MTAHEIVRHSLDYKAIIRRAGGKPSPQTIRYINGFIEYLAAMAELKQKPSATVPA